MQRLIPVINGLRGLAILGVIYHHIFVNITHAGWRAVSVGGFRIFPYTILANGNQAVDLFFILSGVVLFLPYAEGSRTMETLRDVIVFYRRRSVRLFPVLIGSTLAAIVLQYGFDWAHLMTLFLQTMLDVLWPFPTAESGFYPTINWVLWSLRVELWFSILFPVLALGIRHFGAAAVTLSTIALDTFIRGTAYPHWTQPHLFFFDSFIVRLDAFVLGMALVVMLKQEEKIFRKRWPLFAGIGMILAGFWLTDVNILDGVSNALCILYPPRILAISIGFTLLTGSLIVRRSLVARLVSLPALQIIGMMSYSVYVFHAILLNTIDPRPGIHPAIAYASMLTLFSLVSFLTLERGSFARLSTAFEVPTTLARNRKRMKKEATIPEERVGAF